MEDKSYGWAQVLNSYGANCYRFTKETLERLTDDRYLDGYGYKVFSQNDEDGIIQEIFSRIGITDKKFVEFGVENGLENNTHYLLLQDWTGLWIEGNENDYWRIRYNFHPAISAGKLKLVNAYVDVENINELLKQNGFLGEIDILSVDIDGNDYHVLQAINAISPRVVAVEYNGKFPPPCTYCMMYDANHRYDGTDNHGASLQTMTEMMERKGYELVGTTLNGVNAFYVRHDLTQNHFPYEHTAAHLYNPARFGRGADFLMFRRNEHPSRYFLGYYGENRKKDVLPLRPIDLQKLKEGKSKCILWGAGKCGKIVGDFLTANGVEDYVYCDMYQKGAVRGKKIITYDEMESLYKSLSPKPYILICAVLTMYEMTYRAIASGIVKECYHVLPILASLGSKDDDICKLSQGYAKTMENNHFFTAE